MSLPRHNRSIEGSMHILVIDRDALATQLLQARLEARGHKLVIEPNKNAAFDRMREEKFDCVMIDPAPMSEARPVIIGVWKSLRGPFKPYILLLSKSATREDAILAGTNDVLNKPFDPQALESKVGNAERLIALHHHLGADDDDVRSGGGMIGKAAFNQLFLSAIDRAFRYGERSLVILVRLRNLDELRATSAGVDDMLAALGERLTLMRRQSDVIGRIGAECFGILLQRPMYENEPIDAINRFSEALDKFHHSFDEKADAPLIDLELVELPQGALLATRHAPLRESDVRADVAPPADN